MQQVSGHRSTAGPAVLGVILVAVGLIAIAVREADMNLFPGLGAWGWPLLVIVPGLVLLAVALIPAPPAGIGFAIAGAVVTTIGGILLYGSQSGHWERWAYLWAFIPFAVGSALFVYGQFARSAGMVRAGEWVAGIAGIALLIGAWLFEGLFTGATPFVDVGSALPVLLVVIGAVLTMWALLRPALSARSDPAPREPQIH